MQGYILKRILFAAFTIFVVLTVVFFVFRLGPADPVSVMLPPDATPKDAENLTKKFGLDQPLMTQYVNYIKNAVQGDFGASFRFNEPALKVLFERFPATLQLGLVAFVFSVLIGLSVQAQILNLLIDLQKKLNRTYIIISHDLAVVEHVSSMIGVMYLGYLMELAPSRELYRNAKHPYTRALLESVPVADPENIKAVSLEGEVPSPLNPPPGCTFHPRCNEAKAICCEIEPNMREVSPGHYYRCH